ncbi:InlB B-repeat-containing protein [Adhaeribacter radiodurans]|uniref:Ig-like domain-containing protein n=1 Tax=Adhaeribacter radiodurans TaxID=2745197 RepID=A0A7L7L9H7_9BACT|nr:Ig-like domain-containing protein [Adhaeribacter radiodurans]QMU29384.1 Ig-like domain-containing protein [Adhaeribacter radiodurans]
MKKNYTYYQQFLGIISRKWVVVAIFGFLISFQGYLAQSALSKKTSNTKQIQTANSDLKIAGFNLINANNDKAIQLITDGAVLNLAALPTRKLNIQAVTDPAKVGSVLFYLAGPVVRNHTENTAPYGLYRDVNGDFSAWTPPLGDYTLIATPYSQINGRGTAGTSSVIRFSVINQAQYTLTVASNEGGSVTKSPDQTRFNKGESVTLTATAAEGYQFNGWSGAAKGRANPLTLVMDGNKNLKANFGPLQPPGALISYLISQSPRLYTVSELTLGTLLYTDRTYQATSVPAFLNGAPFIKTPNDDKANRLPEVLSFELSQEATVYVAYDPLALVLPAWLSYWQKTTESIGINDPRIDHLDLYSKTFPAGTVTIGGNLARPALGSKNTYIVAVKASDNLRPYVTAVRPADGAADVPLDQSISVDLKYPSGQSINGNTVNPNTVKLFTVVSNDLKTPVEGTAVNASAAGDAITLSATLAPNTTYEFVITEQVQDGLGYSILPFTSRFSTTNTVGDVPTDLSGVSFTEQTLVDNTFGFDGFTSLTIGPDRRFYATTSGGKIERWDINPDGSLANNITIAPFDTTRRLLIGFRFDPNASATNLIAWISHSSGAFTNVPDWAGKISQINLNDPAQPIVTDYVINLPRSYKDHSTNSIDFGPDGALYFTQGSNSAMGAPDDAWGLRAEHLLTATVLRLDVNLLQQQSLPLDAKTEEGGTYNPYIPNAPLTIYATGLRNAYDLIWHSNGELYVPTNGSAAGGNLPELKAGTIWSNGQPYPGPDIPAIMDVRDTQSDYLFRIAQGGYYGHPNYLRNEYILNGGNPTEAQDPGEVVWTMNGVQYGYPVGTPTEPNYRGWSYDFGTNKSPDGVIEYKSNAFEGKLKGKLLVCRFSGGDDVIVLEPGTFNKDIIKATEGIKIPGLRRPFSNPLNIVEDLQNGNLYLSEYYDGNGDGKPRITLLRADQPAPATAARKNLGENIAPESAAAKAMLKVYPNPNAGDKIYADVQNFAPQELVTLTLYDVTGRLIQTKTSFTDQKGAILTEIYHKQPLKSGLYIIGATAVSGKKQAKLLVK